MLISLPRKINADLEIYFVVLFTMYISFQYTDSRSSYT
jgi:hypothetical protein